MIKSLFHKNRAFISNLLWRAVQVLSKQGITLIIFFLAAKLLDPTEFGNYNYILTTVTLLTNLSDFGISLATTKTVAEYLAQDSHEYKQIFFNALLLILGISSIVMLFVTFFGKQIFGDNLVYIYYCLPLLILVPISSVFDGIFRGLEKYKYLSLTSLIAGTISVIITYFLTTKYGLKGALISQNIFFIIHGAFLVFEYFDYHFVINKKLIKEIGKYSTIIGIGSIGLFLYSRIDILFLGHYGYIKEIAYYELGNKVLMIMLTPFFILGQVLSPKVTRLYAEKQYDHVRKLFRNVFFGSLGVSFIGIVCLVLFSPLFFKFLPQYNIPEVQQVFKAMLIIFFIQMINGAIPLGFVFATGHAKISTYFLLIFGSLNVVLNWIFIERFGFIGIVYSSIITRILTDILFIAYYYFKVLRKLKQ
jgi:O-antigen/teichoic acid export membrane protein